MVEPAELPDHVREFVAGLNESDVDTLKSIMRMFRDLQGLCRFTRWIVYTLVAAGFVIWQGTDGIRHLYGLIAPKTGN